MQNIFSRLPIKKLLDRDPSKFEPRPYFVWAVIFSATTAGVILIISLHLSFSAYLQRSTSSLRKNNPVANNEVKLNRAGLHDAVQSFEKRTAEFQALLLAGRGTTTTSAVELAPKNTEAISPILPK